MRRVPAPAQVLVYRCQIYRNLVIYRVPLLAPLVLSALEVAEVLLFIVFSPIQVVLGVFGVY